MTSLMTNKFSPEVRDRAVRMVLDHEGEHPSLWAEPPRLLEWVKKADRDSGRSQASRRMWRRS